MYPYVILWHYPHLKELFWEEEFNYGCVDNLLDLDGIIFKFVDIIINYINPDAEVTEEDIQYDKAHSDDNNVEYYYKYKSQIKKYIDENNFDIYVFNAIVSEDSYTTFPLYTIKYFKINNQKWETCNIPNKKIYDCIMTHFK